MILTVGALVWTGLVLGNWWPAFRFDPRDALRAWSLWGLPLRPEDAVMAVRGHAHAALIAGLVLLAIRGAGVPIVRLAGVRIPGTLAALPIGIGVAGAAWLALGLLGLLRPGPSAWITLGAFVAAGGRFRPRRVFPPWLSGWAIAAAAGCGLAALPAVLVPEVTYDAMAVHLGAPERWLTLGRIVRLDAMMFSDFPLAPQMAYLVSQALGGGDGAAKWLHALAGLGAVGMAGWLGAALAGHAGANWAIACGASVPMVVTQMTRANVDLWTVWAAGAGVWWLLRPQSRKTLILAGLCLGAAAAGKLTAGIGIGAGLGMLILNASRTASSSFLFLCFALLPLFPWLLKSLLFTGNPVYPFLWSVLGGSGWSVAAGAAWAKDMSEANSFNLQYAGVISRFAAPWTFVMHDRNSGAALAPFALCFAPLLLLIPGAGRFTPAGRRAVAVAAGWATLFWLGWHLFARDPRFMLPAWPAFTALAVAALLAVSGPAGALLRAAAGLSVAVGIVFSAATAAVSFAPGPVALGAVPRAAYRARLIAPPDVYLPVQRQALDAAGARGRVLVIGDVKAPACRGRGLYPSMYDMNPVERWIRESTGPARFSAKVRQAGVTAVFHHESGAAYLHDRFGHFDWTPQQAARFRLWMTQALVAVRVVPVDDGRRVLGAYAVKR